MTNELNEEGLAAARKFAQWEIGDSSWANLILKAYFDPAYAHRHVDAAKARYER